MSMLYFGCWPKVFPHCPRKQSFALQGKIDPGLFGCQKTEAGSSYFSVSLFSMPFLLLFRARNHLGFHQFGGRPNCFNLLFQMRLVQRMKKNDIAGLEGWFKHYVSHQITFLIGLKHERLGTRPARWAEAYKIGRLESSSAWELLRNVDDAVTERLSRSCEESCFAFCVFPESM